MLKSRKSKGKDDKPKVQKQPGKAALVRKLDVIFSKFIRLRDMLPNSIAFRCISCGRFLPISQADCGHYINRQHMATRWNEKNCNAQCRQCNRFDEGNQQGYRQGLIQKYGEYNVLILEASKYKMEKFSEFELKTLIEYYQKEVGRILEERNLEISCLTR